jgi:hypothetical protein
MVLEEVDLPWWTKDGREPAMGLATACGRRRWVLVSCLLCRSAYTGACGQFAPGVSGNAARVIVSLLTGGLVFGHEDDSAPQPAGTICGHDEAQDQFCARSMNGENQLCPPAVCHMSRHRAVITSRHRTPAPHQHPLLRPALVGRA